VFPVDPDAIDADATGLFICQDSVLRSRILPLFRFDPGAAADRPLGQGTAFRINPWFGCLTAFHVVEDLFEVKDEAAVTLKDGLRLAVLQIDGLGFGRFAMPENAWRPLSGAFSIFGIEPPPLAAPRIRNVTELIALRIQPANPDEPAPYLPVDLRRWQPRLGEIVLGLGFVGLDRDQADEGGDRPIEQYLQGAFGRITEIVPAAGERGRPWPMIRVDTDWPGGMSGGPVFNEAGHVIGVISAGIRDQRACHGVSYFLRRLGFAGTDLCVHRPRQSGLVSLLRRLRYNRGTPALRPGPGGYSGHSSGGQRFPRLRQSGHRQLCADRRWLRVRAPCASSLTGCTDFRIKPPP
jgi:serine protease Do